jgi:hypothetical protein
MIVTLPDWAAVETMNSATTAPPSRRTFHVSCPTSPFLAENDHDHAARANADYVEHSRAARVLPHSSIVRSLLLRRSQAFNSDAAVLFRLHQDAPNRSCQPSICPSWFKVVSTSQFD